MVTNAAYAQPPWGGVTLPAPDIGDIPPPIPGDPATFSYNTQLGARPWAGFAWAGGYPLAAYPGGGVLAHPDASHGVVTVSAWWPDAPVLQLVRITSDGVRTPVRGGYPITVTTTTRRNYISNPSVEVGANGYVPADGAPTLAQLADAAAPAGAAVLRSTNAGSGSNGVTVPTALTVVPLGRQVTVGWSMRTSARPTTVTVTIAWTDALGGALSSNTATLTADQINASVSQFGRQVITVTPPTGAVTPNMKIVAGGMPAGGTMDLDALTFELDATDGSFFDGRTLGGVWVGTADLSASVLSPVATISDGECPTDVLVSYQVSNPGITGGRVVSDPTMLVSNGTTWLTHPLQSSSPVAVNLTAVPKQERAVEQGSFLPIGAARPIVVTSARRQASTGTFELVVFSFAERDALVTLFATPSPILLRPPGIFGYTAGLWLALGTITEDRQDGKGWQATVFLVCEFVEVDTPSVL